MKNNVISKASVFHYEWAGVCDSWVLVDTLGLSVKEERMPQGASEKLHVHSIAQQFFYVLKGTASFYTEDKKQRLTEQQGLLVLPGSKHFIANEENEELIFLVISQPSTHNDRQLIEE